MLCWGQNYLLGFTEQPEIYFLLKYFRATIYMIANKIKNHIKPFLSFSFIAGIGWLVDISIFTVLTAIFQYSVLYSNCLSSFVAITLVFTVSTKRIFIHNNEFMLLKFIMFGVFQLFSIWFFSHVIYLVSKYLYTHFLLTFVFIPVIVKISVTPFTLLLNYLLMKVILRIG